MADKKFGVKQLNLISETPISVKEFGAKGDGTTDDTTAIQAAFSSSVKAIFIPEGTYRISSPITSTVDSRRIYGPGVFTATSAVNYALEITADDNQVTINVAGNSSLRGGVKINGGGAIVRDCDIKDLYAPTPPLGATGAFSCYGIHVDISGKTEGVTIINNVIKNVEAVGDSSGGNANGIGMSRGIMVRGDGEIDGHVTISNNTIEGVKGEEGDAILIINSNAGVFYELNSVITNNRVTDFTRRGVKIQAAGSRIFNNVFKNSWTADNPSFQAVIDLVQGGDHQVVNNSLHDCKYMAQIKINSAGEALDDVIVRGNMISGVGSETSTGDNAIGNLIYLKTNGNGTVVEGNTLDVLNYTGTCINVVTRDSNNDPKNAYVNSNTIITNGTKYSITANNVQTYFPMGVETTTLGVDTVDATTLNTTNLSVTNFNPSSVSATNVTASSTVQGDTIKAGANPQFNSNTSSDAGFLATDIGSCVIARTSTTSSNACLTLNRMDLNAGRHINFYIKGSSKAYIGGDGSGGVTNVVNTSDYRTKTNVLPLGSAVEQIKALRPVSFTYKDSPGTTNKGFIAHELQAVEPLAAYGVKDGPEMQTVDTTKLIPLLTKALQEALERIEQLENQLSH